MSIFLKKILIVAMVTLLAVLGTAQVSRSIIGVDEASPSQTPLPLDRYTGVAYIEPAQCTGALLKGGLHVLTAAHCLNEGGIEVDPENLPLAATFKLPNGDVIIPVRDYFIHPGWTGYESEVGNDIAILRLARRAPRTIKQYEIYRRSDEVGKVFTKIGYGYIGVGDTGQDEDSNSEAQRYAGQNRYDALVDIFKSTKSISDFSELVLGSQLIFDFDNGTSKNDAFGRHFPNLADRGLGINEIASGSGDSGGPSFIDGKIAGVTSWGCGDSEIFSKNLSDIDADSLNGSFGEFSGDTRVSYYAKWIDRVTAGAISSNFSITPVFLILGMILGGNIWQSGKRQSD